MVRSAAHRIRPGFPTMLARAVRRRCPWCSRRRAWLAGWFRRVERCPGCGLRWERQPGFMTGSMTINIIVTFGLMTAVLVGVMIATLPDLPVTPLLVALVGIGIVVPIAIHPLSCTVWAAVDLAMHPPDAGELEQARSALDGGTPASPPSASS